MTENYFHDWKLIEHCGGGAYGDVYYCEDISGKKMALKIVSKIRLGDSWKRELRGVRNYQKVAAKVPQLLQIFHVSEDEENFFYTMEPADPAGNGKYIPDTLARRLQSGPLPEKDVFPILHKVFNGIKLLHDNGFAHRDIKPDNILFVKGVPKLADIGLLSNIENTMTLSGGTLHFIPPEEFQSGSLLAGDKLSGQYRDLYAFGKVIYCAITGMGAQKFPSVPGELQHTPQLKYFSRLSFSLCSNDPDQRLTSLRKLACEFADIKRILRRGETSQDKAAFWFKRHWGKVAAAAVPVLLLAGSVIYLAETTRCQVCHNRRFVEQICETCFKEFGKLPSAQKIEQLEQIQEPAVKEKLVPLLLDDIAADWAAKLEKPGYGDKTYFDDLLKQCEKICALKSDTVERSKIGKFAREYVDYYHENITVEITGIRGKKNADIERIELEKYFLVVNQDYKDASDIAYNITDGNEFEVELSSSVTVRPWEKPSIWMAWILWNKSSRFLPAKKERHTERITFNFQSQSHHTAEEFDCTKYFPGFDHLWFKYQLVAGTSLSGLCKKIFGTGTPDPAAIRAMDN